jgi:molybdopterin-guanine dinucleotide biosynthesis protein A
MGGTAAGRIATISAAILAGGASSRMGSDKAFAKIGGVAAATRIAHLLGDLFEEVLLVGGEPPREARGRRVADLEGPTCALRGLRSALEAAAGERVLVVATDLPLVTPALLLALVAWPEADAVVPRTGGGRHPLCALYRLDAVLPVARSRLATGELKLSDLLDALDTRYLDGRDLERVDPEGIALTNVNTPDDLARAESLLARAGAIRT